MRNQKISAAGVTLWAGRGVAVVVAVLAVTLTWLLDWYCSFRALSQTEYRAIQIAYYFCAVVLEAALWQMDKLLRNILAGQVFVWENVTRLRWMRLCCVAVALICLPAAFCYLPLIFVVAIMAFLALAVSVAVQLMKAATAIREENDLTI